MTPDMYVSTADAALRQLADSVLASRMAAYMLDQFEFLGIQAPVRRKAILAALPHRWSTAEDVLSVARRLWEKPEREFRYTAIDLLRRQARLLNAEHVAPILELLQCDASWDSVDGLSAVIGLVLRAEIKAGNKTVQEVCDTWITHDNHWVRRCAMLHQLGWRLDTDTERLSAYAQRLAPEKEFFIRKAIGWALRDYARWNPAFVQSFIDRNRTQLSGLTIREAAKHLPRPELDHSD